MISSQALPEKGVLELLSGPKEERNETQVGKAQSAPLGTVVENLKEGGEPEGPGIPTQFRAHVDFSPKMSILGTEGCVRCGKR